MRLIQISLSIVLCTAFHASASADAIPDAEHKSLQSFAETNKTCREWTDGCAVCLRNGDTFECSLPGIACQPSGLTCKAEIKDPQPSTK